MIVTQRIVPLRWCGDICAVDLGRACRAAIPAIVIVVTQILKWSLSIS